MAECFRAAKKHLWDGVSEVDLEGAAYLTQYVCSAIARTRAPGAAWARTEISRRLAGRLTVGCWLASVGVPWGDLTNSALQEYRHAWLDSLIAEFEGTEE